MRNREKYRNACKSRPLNGEATKKQGFTLIELSIVLVIIGLLVGGVLVGQDLIKAAELRAIVSEKEKFQTATNTFRLKYNCLPGDCKNATTFFGTASVCPGDGDNPRTDGTTCNGNGDKIIYHNAAGGGQNESFGYWQHLAIAGLIDGSYTGVTDSTTSYYSMGMTAGSNVPKGAVSGSLWSVFYLGTVPISNYGFAEGFYGNVYFFSGDTDIYHQAIQNIISPVDAFGIDSKIDDGYPMLGKVAVATQNPNASLQCYVTDTGTGISGSTTQPRAINTIVYNTDKTTSACSLIFKNVF